MAQQLSDLAMRITPEHTGTSAGALEAARAILALDGLAPFRATFGSDHDDAAVIACFARIIDRELKAQAI